MIEVLEVLVSFSLVAASFTAIGAVIGHRLACKEILAHMDRMRDESDLFEP